MIQLAWWQLSAAIAIVLVLMFMCWVKGIRDATSLLHRYLEEISPTVHRELHRKMDG